MAQIVIRVASHQVHTSGRSDKKGGLDSKPLAEDT